jgi:hypothetical protein
MGPESAFVVPAVTAACAGVAGAFGAVAAWTNRRSGRREADLIVDRLVANVAFGVPLDQLVADLAAGKIVGEVLLDMPTGPATTRPASSPVASPAAGTGRPAAPTAGGRCHGRLTVHEDGSLSCHGGLADCWPATAPGRYRHAARVSCRDIDHGCGVCDAPKGMGPDVDPPLRADTTCARGCGRPGAVWVAASGSLPTLVCSGCATAIAAGRTWRVADDRRARAEHAPGLGVAVAAAADAAPAGGER